MTNASMDSPVFDRIRSDVSENDVVLYMKGTPVFPQCGFSGRGVVQVLTHLGVPFKGDRRADRPPACVRASKEYSSMADDPAGST